MKNKILLLSIVLISIAVVSGCGAKDNSTQTQPPAGSTSHEDVDGYWTCPMHPQVHQHEKGKCPICGMDLIHVDGKKSEKSVPQAMDAMKPSEINVSDKQLALAAVSRYTVARKDLVVSIPVSGSALSSEEIALQIYESDSGLVKMGSDFSGTPSSSPQETWKGKIKMVDTLIDPTSHGLKAIGVLDTPQKAIGNGGFQGVITSQIKDQLVIPEESVLHAGTRDLVYLISSDNRVSPKTVVIGGKSSGEYQVLAGLQEGDVISTGPNFLLDSESKIRGGNDQANH
ncbi:MAG: hypothetical protein IPJ69_03735 [Deltaproteobacteria bacterium]|nr:MAG: hypothetical protein IPJ69_03735 [Deltaproteobacteria bacterium]